MVGFDEWARLGSKGEALAAGVALTVPTLTVRGMLDTTSQDSQDNQDRHHGQDS